ncbi:ABC-type transport auxiliary lipoprotein family protein [uncultured Litoreibacter sp.]|uniref:PqiC family protein n=1 Tax=uncultured Litoreibacter sp. TaxID=1392394 RepID=UPI002622260D|nr:ABC-type transport auxiliary lipoprotein family protein [uncultured Litoreibacter sp.]
MFRTRFALAAVMALGACGGDADRYTAAPPAVTETIRIGFGSVEIRDVTLPSYAAADEITLEGEGGVLKSSTSVLWADAPERAIALDMTRNLSKLTSARIASDPWPFEAFPDARLEIRFEELLAGSDGIFRASGQYFVAVEEGRERSGLFEQSAPFDLEGGPAAIAAARGQVVLDLAKFIARNGLK